MRLSPKELLNVSHRELRNGPLLKGRSITGISTDSRNVREGDIFFALRGERFDGHKFLEEVYGKGSAAAVVAASARVPELPMPMLVVDDTVLALGELAARYRLKFKIPVLAIGGSNGKTTTKEMISRALGMEYTVLSTEGNLNNQIGVPLTLFRLMKRHEVAVVELGTNHPGEIEYLCRIVQPTHGVITNIGHEHLEFFGTLDGVADEEASLFQALRERKSSVAFLNADDALIRSRAKGMKRKITYGMGAKRADVRGKILGHDETGCAHIELSMSRGRRPLEVQLAVPGEHNAMNAIAAAAVGMEFKIPAKKIRKALQSFKAADKRMEVVNLGGVIIYNDTYNANPDSMLAALHTLASARIPGKRIAVLGDMRELGGRSAAEHARIGSAIPGLGIEYLLTYGTLAEHIHDAAQIPMSVHYDQKNILAEYLSELIAPGDAVLVKGSRGMKMEDIVTFLEERLSSAVVPFG